MVKTKTFSTIRLHGHIVACQNASELLGAVLELFGDPDVSVELENLCADDDVYVEIRVSNHALFGAN